MTDLFTLDIMIGYVLPIQDDPCLIPTVTLKLLDFPSLTVHCILPSEQEDLKEKFHSDFASGIRGSQNRIIFKKGKSCTFKLSKQDTQKLYIPLTIILNDAWYLPVKELARTCIDILVPHFKQGSVIPPINSSKQIYELCNANGSKVAMIELSYKLKRNKTDVSDAVSNCKAKHKEDASKKEKLEKSMNAKEILFPQKPLEFTDDTAFNKLNDKLTICPPPLLYSANSDNDQEKLQTEAEAVTGQGVSQVVWPNGYIHAEPGWNMPKEDDFNTVLLPSCPQNTALPIAQDVSNNQNFWILRALVKELSAMEQILNSKGVIHPVQKCSDVYVQTENMSSSESDDKLTPTKITKKLKGQQKKFTRECCVAKQDHSPFKQPRKLNHRHIATPPQNKITSPRIKIMHQMASPRNKIAPSTLNKSRTRKLKIRLPLKHKPPPQLQLNSAVSRVSQIPNDKNDKPPSEEFSVNTSVEHKGDQSKLNLEIHLPTVTMTPSVTAMSLKQDDSISSASIINTVGLLTVPADSITPSVTSMASSMPLTSASQTVTPLVSALALSPASQSVHLTQASSNDVQSYANLSLSESTEDVLNQSHISNLVFSAKHLKAVLADDKSAKDTSPTSDHDKLSNVDTISPAESNESVQYKDDFESSDCSSKETLSS